MCRQQIRLDSGILLWYLLAVVASRDISLLPYDDFFVALRSRSYKVGVKKILMLSDVSDPEEVNKHGNPVQFKQ